MWVARAAKQKGTLAIPIRKKIRRDMKCNSKPRVICIAVGAMKGHIWLETSYPSLTRLDPHRRHPFISVKTLLHRIFIRIHFTPFSNCIHPLTSISTPVPTSLSVLYPSLLAQLAGQQARSISSLSLASIDSIVTSGLEQLYALLLTAVWTALQLPFSTRSSSCQHIPTSVAGTSRSCRPRKR